MTCRRLLALVLAAACPAVASAQGTITHGDVSFSRTGTPFDATPTATLIGAAEGPAQDHLFAFGWWFRRVGVDTLEKPLPVPGTQTYLGASSTLILTGINLEFEEVATVGDMGALGVADGGAVEIVMTVHNLSSTNPIQLELYAMTDLDVAGPDDDSAQIYLEPRYLTIYDGSLRAELYGVSANGHLVREAGATDVAALLNDASVTNFDSTGLPFGPGNFTAGLQ